MKNHYSVWTEWSRLLRHKLPLTLQGAINPFLDLAGDRVVFLAGSGRSGTTWVQEIINYRHDHRVIFEPFQPKEVNFLAPQSTSHLYLRPEEQAPSFRPQALRILFGRFRTVWSDQSNPPGIYRRRLIKDIRANLLLRWLAVQMPSLKIVFLMRHPCAVSLSQIKMGWLKDPTPLRRLVLQPNLATDFLQPLLPLILAVEDPFEINILFWAIQNYVPLKQFSLHPEDSPSQRDNILLLFYEELCTEPERELTRLFNFLELSPSDNVFRTWHKPSTMAKPWSAVVSGASLVDGWRDEVSSQQVDRAVTLLRHFGLDQIYHEGPMPSYRSKPVYNI